MSAYRNSSYSNNRNKNSSYRPRRQSSGNDWATVLLCYVLPFLVVNSIIFFCATTKPKFELTVEDNHDYLTTQVTMTVKSWFPVKTLYMDMASEKLKLEKKGNTYTAQIHKNGTIEAYVCNINGMSETKFEHINVLDDNPPSIENPKIEDGIVTLTISDSQSGINYDSITATNSIGNAVSYLALDKDTGSITFEMDPDGLYITAQDKAGNKVQASFTSHKEDGVETINGGMNDSSETGDDSALTPIETEDIDISFD